MKLALLILAAALPAAGAEPCPAAPPAVVRNVQASAGELGSGKCFVSIRPFTFAGMVYRDYAFYSDGMLLVFSSYGEGGSEMTSGREFRLFPRLAVPRLELDAAAGSVAVVAADGARFSFDPDTAQPSSTDRGTVRVSPRVSPAERGGVELPSYAGLVLDSGYRRGELPSGRPKAESEFRDASGRTCRIVNEELFAYEGGDARFKLGDAELSAWLKERCPALSAGF